MDCGSSLQGGFGSVQCWAEQEFSVSRQKSIIGALSVDNKGHLPCETKKVAYLLQFHFPVPLRRLNNLYTAQHLISTRSESSSPSGFALAPTFSYQWLNWIHLIEHEHLDYRDATRTEAVLNATRDSESTTHETRATLPTKARQQYLCKLWTEFGIPLILYLVATHSYFGLWLLITDYLAAL